MKTVIVDGHNFLLPKLLGRVREGFHSYYAVYAMIQNIAKIIRFTKADRAVLCWDGGKSKRRLSLHKDYKGTRPKLDEDIRDDINISLELVSTLMRNLRLHVIPRKRGVEADDIIATICLTTKGRKVIASTDSDFYQLITSDILGEVICLNPQKLIYTNRKKLVKLLGITPEQYVLWKCIVGDTSDAIKGVPGVGPKLTTRLLSQFGSIAEARRARNTYSFDKRTKAVFSNQKIIDRNRGLIDLTYEVESLRGYVSKYMKRPACESKKRVEKVFAVIGLRRLFNQKKLDAFYATFGGLK